MKRQYNNSILNIKTIYYIIIMLCVLFLNVGFSSLSASLDISNMSAVIPAQKDIRVTNITLENTSNSGSSINEGYSINSITSSINLPNSNSTVTYNIAITNIGNTEMGIREITGLSTNLTYSLSNYNLKDTLCDDNDPTSCKLGSITTIAITIGYTNNGYNNSNTNYQIEMNIHFSRVYTITYNGFTNTSNLPSTILENDTRAITFNNNTGIAYDVLVTNAIASYNSPILTLSNPTDNVIINRYYKITYNLNSGTNSNNNPDKFLSTDTISLEDPTYTNNYFHGWYENSSFTGNKVTTISNRNSDVVLYAKWEPIYTITYVLNNGNQANNQVVTFLQSDPKTILDPTRDNYDFEGWFKESDFSGTRITTTGQLNGNTTLHAKWEPVYIITYVLNGGTQGDNQIYSFKATNSQTLVNPTNSHDANFDGWYENSGLTGTRIRTTGDITTRADTTLYAKWVSGISNTTFSSSTNRFTSTNLSSIAIRNISSTSYRYTQNSAQTTINSVKIIINYTTGKKGTGTTTCQIAGSSTGSTTLNLNSNQTNATVEGTITLNTPIQIGSSYTVSCPSYTGGGNGANAITINSFEFHINP